MKRVLVLAYAVSPVRGSEYGIAWEYIMNMSKNNHLTVLCGCSGSFVGDFKDLREYISNHTVPNVDFVMIEPSKWTGCLNYLNKKRILVYTWYFSYKSWHKQVYEKAKELISVNHYDLVHYLGPLGYREPGYLWKLGLPYMWGPVSGTLNYPSALFDVLHVGDRIKFSFRSFANIIQFKYKNRLKKALSNTDVFLTCTTLDQENFQKVHHKNSIYLPEFSLPSEAVINQEKFNGINKQINLIFVGTLDGRKAVIIQLLALCKVKKKSNVHLDIIGDGIRRRELEKFVEVSGLRDIVTFHGRIPREEVSIRFDRAHLNIITSLGEANTVTIFEAISRGVPSLSLDHCGMHDTVTKEVGYPIQIHNLEQVVNDIAATLNHIIDNPMELIEKSNAVAKQSCKYLWSDRISLFERCYEECIKKHDERRTPR